LTTVSQLLDDADRIKLNLYVVELVKSMAAVKFMAAGQGLSSDVELLGLATQVADAYMPAVMERYWSELNAHTKREIAKARAKGLIGDVSVDLYPDKVGGYLLQHLDMAVKNDSVTVTFDGEALRTVQRTTKAAGAPPQIVVNVPQQPPAEVYVTNEVHVPQQAAPVVNVQPSAPAQPSSTVIEYEIGPDGKQRPKAIHRK
jgi:hypothetical protein